MGIFGRLNSLTARATLSLLGIITVGIVIVSVVAYQQIDAYARQNIEIRLDRAARAAAAITAPRFADTFSIERNGDGQPQMIRMSGEQLPSKVEAPSIFDDLVLEIGSTNQGAANFFRWNEKMAIFDRFATTFRRPDGSMPPPMALGPDHPAYATLMAGRVFKGEVPVMGRLRHAYLTPIASAAGQIVGVLAIDVGWVDDLLAGRDQLRRHVGLSTLAILLVVAAFGAVMLRRQLEPLTKLATFAHHIAEGGADQTVPFAGRSDEIGQLAEGLGRVVELKGRLATLAYSDPVTGLGNRARFLVDLERTLASARAGSCQYALLMLDLDHFKQVNDAFGHQAGDAMLRVMAMRIQDGLGPDAVAARIGGDEFAVLIPYVGRNDELARCTALLQAMARPVLLPQGELQTRASIGIALLPADAATGEDAYRNADLALRRSKNQGRDRCTFYDPEFNDTAQRTMDMARQLRVAIDQNMLAVHFQPQVSTRTHGIFGLEALARWPHPTCGFIPPSEFIPVAESNGLIGELGLWVLNEACRTGRQWLDTGINVPHISVKVSAVQLWQPDFVPSIRDALARHGFPGSRLCLEVTESLFVNHSEERILSVLNRLRELGIRVSLDDFGSGYSSLGYLNRLPLDELKVDRSFVSHVDKDPRKQRILRGIVALGRGLGLQIVVEGAETEGEVQFLRTIKCDAIQGYFFARPVPALMVPVEIARLMGRATAAGTGKPELHLQRPSAA